MIADLKDEGWYLTDEGLEICKEGLDKVTTEAVIKKAIDTDLREIGGPFLSDEIHKEKSDYISGPCVLQVQKMKNVTSPKNVHSSSGPPLLRMLVTDGHVFVSCLQWGQWKNISLDTPPGTKIKIKPMKVQVQNGFLLLSDKHFTVLGGHVSVMVEKWELGKSLASHVRRGEGSDDGPPPWIPFGKSINYKDARSGNLGNFKSLEQEAKEEKEHTVFKQQRLANIAEVSKAKEGKVKVFGGGKDKQQSSTASNDQPTRNFMRDRQSTNPSKDFHSKNEIGNSVQNPVHDIQNTFQAMSISSPAQTLEKYTHLQRNDRDDRRGQQFRTDNFRKPETDRFRSYDTRNRYDDRNHTKYESDNRSDMRNGYASSPNFRSNTSNRYDNDTRTFRNENEKAENQGNTFVKPGAEVMARYWEDKRFYHAKVHAVGENETCVVQFLDYGNYEEVRLNDIRPFFSNNQRPASNNQGYMNNDVGTHFTGVLEFRRGGNKPFVHRGGNNDVNQDQQKDKSHNRPAARLYQPPRLRKIQ